MPFGSSKVVMVAVTWGGCCEGCEGYKGYDVGGFGGVSGVGGVGVLVDLAVLECVVVVGGGCLCRSDRPMMTVAVTWL